MTDAEKMREAAAQACDRIAGNTADFGRDYRRAAGQCAAMIRALPIPDVGDSAPTSEYADPRTLQNEILADMPLKGVEGNTYRYEPKTKLPNYKTESKE